MSIGRSDEDGNPKQQQKLKEDLTLLYEERLPLYEQAALKVTNDGSESIDQIVETLLKKIKNHVEY